MISFIWPSGEAMLAGTGGTETFTAGHVRELTRRGIDSQIVIIGALLEQSKQNFPDLPFFGVANEDDVSKLTGTVIFINQSYGIKTRNKAAIIFHHPILSKSEQLSRQNDVQGKVIITTSIYNAQQWALYLNVPNSAIDVVLPFADLIYGNVRRSKPGKRVRVLYAGRLHPEKGIYTVFEMLHQHEMRELNVAMSIVMAGQHVEEGRVITQMMNGYKYAKLLESRKTVLSMARLLARTDIIASSFGLR